MNYPNEKNSINQLTTNINDISENHNEPQSPLINNNNTYQTHFLNNENNFPKQLIKIPEPYTNDINNEPILPLNINYNFNNRRNQNLNNNLYLVNNGIYQNSLRNYEIETGNRYNNTQNINQESFMYNFCRILANICKVLIFIVIFGGFAFFIFLLYILSKNLT